MAEWSRVQVPLWRLAGFVLGRSELKSSPTLVKKPTGCLHPVGVFNPVMLYLNLFLCI